MLNNYSVKHAEYDDPVSAIFAALADPTRRSILAQLSERDLPVSKLAEPYDMSLPAVSKHLKILEHVGLISKSKRAQQRLCRLEVAKLQEATQWLEDYRRFWEANLDNLDHYLQYVQSTNKE